VAWTIYFTFQGQIYVYPSTTFPFKELSNENHKGQAESTTNQLEYSRRPLDGVAPRTLELFIRAVGRSMLHVSSIPIPTIVQVTADSNRNWAEKTSRGSSFPEVCSD
jgi:hypothetical protein